MEVTRVLVKNIVNVGYGMLSPRAVEMTKKLILDSMACALAGSSAVGMKELNELVEGWGGKPESTIIAFGSHVPSPSAALVNGSMGRALDFDDCHDTAIIHPAVPVVSAGFAIAERRGMVNGKKFITAVALGIDLSCRMSAASPVNMLEGYGWDYSAVYGYFGAAAATAKILGLGENKILNAMGIAYHQSAGNHSQIQSHTTKALGSGFAARGGVTSTLMAEKGLTGSSEPLGEKQGIYDLYLRGNYVSKYLTSKLGKYFMVEDDSFKPYPCCRLIHPFIDASLALVEENNIKPQDVDRVIAYAGHATYSTIGEPLELKQNPPDSVTAQFSIPWALASAIAYRKLGIKHFTEEALRNKKIHRLASKIVVQLDSQLTRADIEPAIVEVRIKEGRNYSKRVDYALGSPKNPLSIEDIMEKFQNCASYAAKPIAKERLDQVVQMVEGLENVADVGQIIALLG